MESQPQNPEFRINPETFTHALEILVQIALPSYEVSGQPA